jgi:hypothetical protein
VDLQQIKHSFCQEDEEDAILLVDPETETVPVTDADGNLLYYCIAGEHILAVDTDGTTTNVQSSR